MERAKRFELSTFSLATRCSTTELRPLILPFIQPLVQHYLIQKLCQYAHFCLPFCLPFVYPKSNECSDVCVTDETIHRSVKKRLIKRSCINDLHFHDLRHEAISRFIERELTIPEAASISGHKAQSMLLRYAHPDLSYIRRRRLCSF